MMEPENLGWVLRAIRAETRCDFEARCKEVTDGEQTK
jgi:hypothetical protein